MHRILGSILICTRMQVISWPSCMHVFTLHSLSHAVLLTHRTINIPPCWRIDRMKCLIYSDPAFFTFFLTCAVPHAALNHSPAQVYHAAHFLYVQSPTSASAAPTGMHRDHHPADPLASASIAPTTRKRKHSRHTRHPAVSGSGSGDCNSPADT